MVKSILSRKADLVYLIFFVIHIPVMFLVDLYPFWPSAIRPTLLDNIRSFYVTTYRDQYFISPPSWFTLFIALEGLYHVPLSFWAIPALLRDDATIPVHLLVFSVEVTMTTLTCIADYMSWKGYTSAEKWSLSQLYVPYLALAVLMGVDMYGRLLRSLRTGRKGAEGTKKRL